MSGVGTYLEGEKTPVHENVERSQCKQTCRPKFDDEEKFLYRF